MAITPKPATRDTTATRLRLRTDRFDELCERRGATTDEAKGELLGEPGRPYPRETVNRFRHGRMQPSGKLMMDWAAALGVTVEELWERSDASHG